MSLLKKRFPTLEEQISRLSPKCRELTDEESRLVNGGGPSVWDTYNGTGCPYEYTTVPKDPPAETTTPASNTPAINTSEIPESTATDTSNQSDNNSATNSQDFSHSSGTFYSDSKTEKTNPIYFTRAYDAAMIAEEKGKREIALVTFSENNQEYRNEIKKVISDKLYYDLDLQNYVKNNTKIVIKRNENDNGNNRKYYQSLLEVKVGDIVLQELKVQSTADGSSKSMGKTIPTGTYEGILLNKSNSYNNAISIRPIDNEISIDSDILIHPDAFTAKGILESYSTTGKPCSEGCQIQKLNDFVDLTLTIKSLGFEYGSYSTFSWLEGDSLPIIIK